MVTDSPIFIVLKKILSVCTIISYLLLIIIPALVRIPFFANLITEWGMLDNLSAGAVWHVIEFCIITTGLYFAIVYYEAAATHSLNSKIGKRGELYAIIYMLLGIGLAIFGFISLFQGWGAN